MKITQTKDWTYSDICTQKDIENFLLTHFCIPRALFRRELKTAREHKYYWFSKASIKRAFFRRPGDVKQALGRERGRVFCARSHISNNPESFTTNTNGGKYNDLHNCI